MKTYLLIAAAVVTQSAALLAQTTLPGAGFQQAQSLGSREGVTGTLWPAAMAGRWMSGKPYSATAVTRTVQVLADGSQIERTQSEALYRDEQGRTRSETNNGKFIRIVDLVAGLAYNLDTTAKNAGTKGRVLVVRTPCA
jgi:hypothetical protein